MNDTQNWLMLCLYVSLLVGSLAWHFMDWSLQPLKDFITDFDKELKEMLHKQGKKGL